MAIVECENINELHPVGLCALPSESLVSDYSYARYMTHSIESAVDQTYTNIELIICDDGSTDPAKLAQTLAQTMAVALKTNVPRLGGRR
jgi:hypothetical protein